VRTVRINKCCLTRTTGWSKGTCQ